MGNSAMPIAMKPAYVCFVEVVPEQGCELDPKEFAGAMVRCYVAAETGELARARVAEVLRADHFRVVQFEWCVDGRNSDWENPEDEVAAALMTEAEETGEVIYGRIDAWKPERPIQ